MRVVARAVLFAVGARDGTFHAARDLADARDAVAVLVGDKELHGTEVVRTAEVDGGVVVAKERGGIGSILREHAVDNENGHERTFLVRCTERGITVLAAALHTVVARNAVRNLRVEVEARKLRRFITKRVVDTGSDGAREDLTVLRFLPGNAERRDLAREDAARDTRNERTRASGFERAVRRLDAQNRITVEEAVAVGELPRVDVKAVFKVHVHLEVGRDRFLHFESEARTRDLTGILFERIFAARTHNLEAFVDQAVNFGFCRHKPSGAGGKQRPRNRTGEGFLKHESSPNLFPFCT